MKDKHPKDIPVDGERYDMTLLKVGYQVDRFTREKSIVVKAIIDNGEKKMATVSGVYCEEDKNQWLMLCNYLGEVHSAATMKEYLKPFRKHWRKTRFNAVVTVRTKVGEYRDTIRYQLSEFGTPLAPSELVLKENRKSRFTRR